MRHYVRRRPLGTGMPTCADGSTYLRWDGLAEFLVSADGLPAITFGWIGPASQEAFQVYLLGQALSFALVKRGHEPLHATSVVVDGRAVVFLGNSGFGKSSLAACFLRAGHQLLTDDLLMLREGPEGFTAYPGPPRIKLFPDMARRHLGERVTGPPMNLATKKRVIALEPHQRCLTPVPLGAIYALASPREVARKQRVRIETLSSRQAFVTLVANTFNYLIVGADRLAAPIPRDRAARGRRAREEIGLSPSAWRSPRGSRIGAR